MPGCSPPASLFRLLLHVVGGAGGRRLQVEAAFSVALVCPFEDVHPLQRPMTLLQAAGLLDLRYHLPTNYPALPAVMSDPGLRPFFQDIALAKLKNKLVSFLAFAFAPSSEFQAGIDVHASISERACRLPALRLCAATQALTLDLSFSTGMHATHEPA